MDVLCQAKSGMGKTAVFVLTTLNQLVLPAAGEAAPAGPSVLVLCHTRELAYQIGEEYNRFAKYMPGVKCAVLFGGVPRAQHVTLLAEEKPSIVVGTPGRVADLAESGELKLEGVKHFVLDECDKMLEQLDMRKVVQQIFLKTPHEKQVMMFSATLSKEVRPICLKFMQDPMEIYVESDSKLTLHGLQQYYVKLKPEDKNRKLADLLDALEFNQVVIFVSKVVRARELDRLLKECNFPSMHIDGGMPQEERIKRYTSFRKYEARILVATNLFGRGIDIERVNIVINYDFPTNDEKTGELAADTYLHRVGRGAWGGGVVCVRARVVCDVRLFLTPPPPPPPTFSAGRFGTKGLAISFVGEDEMEALKQVQARFSVEVPELPDSALVGARVWGGGRGLLPGA